MEKRQETKRARKNQFEIIGELISVEATKKEDKNSSEYISVDAVIKSNIDGVDNEFKINFYSKKLTKTGEVSKLYSIYDGMESMLNTKVSVSGFIADNRFYSAKNNQMVSSMRLSGRFINKAEKSKDDVATFTISGFITTPIHEKKNKDEEIYRYDLDIMQAGYYGDNPSVFTLHIDPQDRTIVNGLNNVDDYGAGATVEVKGKLVFVTTEDTVEDTSVAFGEPVFHVYKHTYSNYFIKSVSLPFLEDKPECYSAEEISNLSAEFKERDVEIQNAAKNNAPSEEVKEVKKPNSRQTSLI